MVNAVRAAMMGWFAVFPVALAADEPLAPGDFAWGRAVETHNSDPLQTLLLDAAIYRGAVGPDLADLRVFNAAGEVVPHAIRPLADPHEQEGEVVEVPLFRVPEGSALARAGTSMGGLTVRERDIAIEIAADGAIVRVDSELAGGEPGPRLPSAYLIDVSQLKKRAVVALDLALAPEPAEFAVALRVEASDDLVHFSPLAASGALARLDQAGHRIERSRVEFPTVARRYLLLSAAQSLPVEVTAVRARLAPVSLAPPRTRERIEGVLAEVSRSPQGREAAAQRGEAERSASPRDTEASEDDQAGERVEFLFDLGGPIPIDRVQVDLPVPNSVVEADLYSAADADGPWLHHFQGLLYQLDRAEGALRNAELMVPPIRRRYFKLVVAEKGGGLGGGAPALEVSWMPEQLLFVARGAGPFALGYGRAQARHARFDAAELIRSAWPPDADPRVAVPRETARLGPVKAVGDPSVLEPRVQPPSPRTLALWAVLVGSVAIVLVLSVRLLRRMESSSGNA